MHTIPVLFVESESLFFSVKQRESVEVNFSPHNFIAACNIYLYGRAQAFSLLRVLEPNLQGAQCSMGMVIRVMILAGMLEPSNEDGRKENTH